MTHGNEIATFGYAVGLAAGDMGTAFAPVVIQKSPFCKDLPLHWRAMCHIKQGLPRLAAIPFVAEVCSHLAKEIKNEVKRHHPFLVIGGDHSSAIGTWSGVSAALEGKGDVGLIWVDAHLDSHTKKTTPSGNIHGMSLAALLGKGNKTLTQVLTPHQKLKPRNVCVIGARSFEPEEVALLEQLQVRIFFGDEVNKKGLSAIMKEAIAIVTKETAGFGLSLDMDSLNPQEAPGVGTPESDGLKASELLKACEGLSKISGFVGLEIVEFNPLLDGEQKTEKLVAALIKSVFEGKEKR
jgi:arginase